LWSATKSQEDKGGEEVQGYFVHEDDHWVGVFMQKRRKLFQATWYLLSQHVVLIGDVDRLVGKFGFAFADLSCVVSLWRYTDGLNGIAVVGFVLPIPDVVWFALMVAALLLPYAHIDLSASYIQRLNAQMHQ